MHHIPLYGRVAWSSTYTWCTQKSRAADERQRVSDMPTNTRPNPKAIVTLQNGGSNSFNFHTSSCPCPSSSFLLAPPVWHGPVSVPHWWGNLPPCYTAVIAEFNLKMYNALTSALAPSLVTDIGLRSLI